jgi:hypothetical protein
VFYVKILNIDYLFFIHLKKKEKMSVKTKKLKALLLITCMAFLCYSQMYGQSKKYPNSPISKVMAEMQKGSSFKKLAIVNETTLPVVVGSKVLEKVKAYEAFTLTPDALQQIRESKGVPIEIEMPVNGNSVSLRLVRVNLFVENHQIKTSSGEIVTPEESYHFQGVLAVNKPGVLVGNKTNSNQVDENSLVSISIFKDVITGFISNASGNYVIGKVEGEMGAGNKYHIVYKDSNLKKKPIVSCGTDDTMNPLPIENIDNARMTFGCVAIHVQTEYDIYQQLGSTGMVYSYIVALFAQTQAIYANDGISVALAGVLIYSTPDPYNDNSTATLLAHFKQQTQSFYGNLGCLLTTRNIGGGEAAAIGGLCQPVSKRLCVAGNMGLGGPLVPVGPWDIYVFTHELGHLMGSRHTHACTWNGNGTGIDGCAPAAGIPMEGSCAVPPLPTNGGTIMSYCHLIGGVGINFSLGFGPQPANLIFNYVNNSSFCATSYCTPCMAPLNFTLSGIAYNSAQLSWTPTAGALSYNIEYKAASSSTWLNAGSTSGNSFNITGLAPLTTYDCRIRAACTSTISELTTIQFTTPTDQCGTPTNLSTYNFTFSWNMASNALNYTLEYKPASSTTWLVVTGIPANSYTINPISLASGTLYDWRVKAICSLTESPYAQAQFTTPAKCADLINLNTTAITGTSATLAWTITGDLPQVRFIELQYKPSSATAWTLVTLSGTANTYNLSALNPGTAYQWRVRPLCGKVYDGLPGSYSQSQFNTLITCATPSNLSFEQLNTCGDVQLNWDPVPGALTYTVQYKKTTSSTWLEIGFFAENYLVLFNLGNATYDWKVKANCADGSSAYTTSTFTSKFVPRTCDPGGVFTPVKAAKQPIKKNSSLQLNPQPASNQIALNFSVLKEGNAFVSIQDAFGRPVWQQSKLVKEGINSLIINTSKLTSGIYMLKVIIGTQVLSSRLVIQH